MDGLTTKLINRIGTAVSHIDETFDVTNTLLLQDQFGTIVGNGTEPTELPTRQHGTTRSLIAVLEKYEREKEMLYGSSVNYRSEHITSTEFRS